MPAFVTETTVELVAGDPKARSDARASAIADLGSAVMEVLLADSSLIDPFVETDLAASEMIVSAEIHAATGKDAESILVNTLRRAMHAVAMPLNVPIDEGAVRAEPIPA